ncbi:nuclear condensin complex subunit smc4 [Moniliophthora roreri]|uniref:Structural maintenance of chromosomes protein 4 n=1 Tax=Moniliophthora roreri TaxID=221103 RepID=A0A0W0G8R5_MONRR|nr:nuclear condensin complex subunit smc4 [Moniliophthora roreri]
MPPRRSSRTRASVEPEPVEVNSGKRKRSQSTAVDVVQEKENVEKPSSRARRSTSSRSSAGPSARSRTSTQNRSITLEEVPETDDENEDDAPPPAKKKRPSLEAKEQNEEDKDGPKIKEKDDEVAAKDDDDEEEEEEKPKRRATRTTRAQRGRPTSSRSRRSSAKPKEVIIESDPEPEESDGEPVLVSKGRRTSGDDFDDAMDEDDEDFNEVPVKKSRQAKRSSTSKTPTTASRASTGRKPRKPPVEISDSEAEASQNASRASKNASMEQVQEEQEEEEMSLFDPPETKPSQSQAVAVPEEPKGPQKRLVIHKLALSFSSIVGPNGSGKSNTIDALLFVFGYRATKMRQGKLSELIHNSARYPDLDECSVEIYFREIIDLEGPDAFEIVQGSEIVVARHAYKNNGSKYTINGRQSSFTEVQTLLKDRGIDLDHKRFLILQGEVESIAQMKPKGTEHDDGLLEYLEDIIGTSKYKEPIEQAAAEMDELNDLRQEKMNRLRLVEKEKSALESKKQEAVDFLKLTNQHVRAKSLLWQWYIMASLQQASKLEKQAAKFESDLKQETEKNKDDVDHLEALQKHYADREQAYKEVQKAAKAAQKDLVDNQKTEVGLKERLKHSSGKVKKFSKLVNDETNTLRTARQTIEDSGEKIEKGRKKLEQHEVNLAKEEKVLGEIQDSLRDKTQVYYDQKEVLQKELQPWNTKINAKQSEIDIASSERDALVKKAEDAKAACDEAEENLGKLRSDQEAKVQEQAKCKADKADLKRRREAAEKKVQDAQNQLNHWRQKAASSHQRVQEAKASQEQNRSQGRVLDGLNRLRDSGRIEGFHGRLGSLGTIPDKYDVAISTACPQLNNMVVDKVEQGQKCLQYLREQNLGRATFMVIEKISFRPDQLQRIETPEGVPRLFDLIMPKEARFAPIFYQAVTNTLVANDIEQANRIAFGSAKRWRVVTLQGQLIDLSGTMSGGGNQPSRGAMSSKLASDAVRPEVLRNYERESEDADKQVQAALTAHRSAQEELDHIIKSGPSIDLAFEKLGMDIETGKTRITEAEKRLRALKSQTKPDDNDLARISKLEKEITSAEVELKRLTSKAAEIEASLKEIEDKILQIGGSKLLAQKTKIEGLRNHIDLTNDEITKAEVAKAKAEKDVNKYTSSVENNKQSLREAEAEVADIEGQLIEVTEYMAGLQARVDEAEAAEESSREDLADLKAQLDAKVEEVEEFRKKEAKIKASLEEVQKEQRDNDAKIEHWTEEIENLKLEEIDDDDDDDDDDNDSESETEELKRDVRMAEGCDEGEHEVKPDPEQSSRPSKTARTKNGLKYFSEDELRRHKQRDLVADVENLDDRLKRAKPNLNVLEEYKRREEEVFNRHHELEKVTEQRDAQKKKHDDLRKRRLDEFMTGFSAISLKLKEMYQMITLGGNAELELVDSMDPFSEGIIFSVMPPKKSWKNISNLSGGEKTLSSLALVFALHVFKPTPLYFMDEIDAALDFRNVSIVANYIKDRTKNAQFIIISLRNDMFELSHRLIGIYKTANVTQSISIDNHALPTPRPVHTPASAARASVVLAPVPS